MKAEKCVWVRPDTEMRWFHLDCNIRAKIDGYDFLNTKAYKYCPYCGREIEVRVERHYVESRYLKNIEALNKRVEELEGDLAERIIADYKAEHQERVEEMKTRIASLEGKLKEIAEYYIEPKPQLEETPSELGNNDDIYNTGWDCGYETGMNVCANKAKEALAGKGGE